MGIFNKRKATAQPKIVEKPKADCPYHNIAGITPTPIKMAEKYGHDYQYGMIITDPDAVYTLSGGHGFFATCPCEFEVNDGIAVVFAIDGAGAKVEIGEVHQDRMDTFSRLASKADIKCYLQANSPERVWIHLCY